MAGCREGRCRNGTKTAGGTEVERYGKRVKREDGARTDDKD